MANQKRTRGKRLVLDIGASAVRLCEFSATKQGLQLTRYDQKELPLDPSIGDEERKAARQQALKELLKENKVRTRKTVFGIPGQSVFSRNRALPPVPEHKVTSIVRYEIQQQIPFSLDQIALDYQVLSRTDSGGYEVLMTACKVDIVDRYLSLLKSAGCSPAVVDACPLASYNWLKYSGELGDQGECVAMVDIGAGTTDIVVERGGQFRFTRSLNIGGNDITSAIAKTFNTGFDEAERVKRERAFAPTGDPQKDGKGGEAVGQVLRRMTGEINRSLAYYRAQPGGAPVERVILTGGGAGLRNIVPFMKKELGVDVRIAQPLANLAVGAKAQAVNEQPERAVTALGLALRSIGDVTLDINLVPPRLLEYARSKEQTVYWALSLVTLGLIVASIIPVQAAQDQRIRENIDMLQDGLRNYASDLAQPGADPTATSEHERELEEVRSEIETLQSQVESLDSAYAERHFWLPYLSVINNARPDEGGVWFSALETTRIGDPPRPGAGRPGGMGGMGGGGGGGDRYRYDDDDDYGFGGFGGMGMGMGMQPGQARIHSTGFPGLAPQFGMGGMGGGMGRPGGMGGMGPGQQQESPPPPEPNGLVIQGYASDAETLLRFVERLENSGVFIEDGVHFNEAFANEVPISELDNAPVGAMGGMRGGMGGMRGGMGGMGGGMGGMGGGGGDRYRYDDDDDFGGMGGMRGGMGGMGGMRGGMQRGFQRPGFREPTYRSFRIDLQFAGEAPDEEAAEEAGPGAGFQGFQGFGFGPPDDDDEEW